MNKTGEDMRTKCLRAAAVRDGLGAGFVEKSERSKSERSMPSTKPLSILATVFLLGLAACTGSQKGCQIVPCSGNCPAILPTPEFLYATSINHVLAFTIDQSSGALSAPLVAAGPNQSTGMVASMNGQLYVSDFLNDAVDGYSISSSGALTAIATSPFSLGGTPPGAGGLSAFVQGGTYLYATDLNAGTVAGFLVRCKQRNAHTSSGIAFSCRQHSGASSAGSAPGRQSVVSVCKQSE